MLRKIIQIWGMFFVVMLQCSAPCINNDLVERHCSVVSMHDAHLGDLFKKNLKVFLKSHHELGRVLTDPSLEEIFTIQLSDQANVSFVNSVFKLQQITLLLLYQKIFQHYIAASETFLNDLLVSKKYWMYEDFYMKQSVFRKNILYDFYSSEYQNTIAFRCAGLQEVENSVAGMLGFCLYGLSGMQYVQDENFIAEHMVVLADKFFTWFTIPNFEEKNRIQPLVMYHEAILIHTTIQDHMQTAQLEMQKHKSPSFIVDHLVGISCATVTALALLGMYVQNRSKINSLYEQANVAASKFWTDYIINPLVGLKEVLWDHKTKKLEHVQHFSDVVLQDMQPSQDIPHYESYSTLLVNPVLNPLVDGLNQTRKGLEQTVNNWKNDTVGALNAWKDSSEQTLNIKIDEANDILIKNNQINMYLAAMVPVLFGTYALSSSGYKMYDHYVKNKSWYLPMRYIIRSIDQLVNQVARSLADHNFIDDGKLYMLIQHFRGYVSCLSGEELFLMHHDIEELLSFNLNYAQKKGIIDRMYKTYDFLK